MHIHVPNLCRGKPGVEVGEIYHRLLLRNGGRQHGRGGSPQRNGGHARVHGGEVVLKGNTVKISPGESWRWKLELLVGSRQV